MLQRRRNEKHGERETRKILNARVVEILAPPPPSIHTRNRYPYIILSIREKLIVLSFALAVFSLTIVHAGTS